MLNKEQIKKDLLEFTDTERKQAVKAHADMLLDCPEFGLINLIKNQSNVHNLRCYQLFEKMIDMQYRTITLQPFTALENELIYTFKWFDFFVRRLIIETPYTDILGKVMTDFSMFDKSFQGQCMTPPDLANAMQDLMNVYAKDKGYAKKNRIGDIACGTGSLLLPKMRDKTEDELTIVMNDIDSDMAKTCFNQCFLNAFYHRKHDKITLLAYVSNAIIEYNKPDQIIAAAELSDNGVSVCCKPS
jgi:type I restriction-modification system DNA methylase subunit